MSKGGFIASMAAFAVVLSIFTPRQQSSLAYWFGESIGISLGMFALGIVTGTILWLPVRAIRGVEKAPDYRLFVLTGTLIAGTALMIGAWR